MPPRRSSRRRVRSVPVASSPDCTARLATGNRRRSVAVELLESASSDSCGPYGASASETDSSVTRAPDPAAAVFTLERISCSRCGPPTVCVIGPDWRRAAVASSLSFSSIRRVCRPGATYRYSAPIARNVTAANSSASLLLSEIFIGRSPPEPLLTPRYRETDTRHRAP